MFRSISVPYSAIHIMLTWIDSIYTWLMQFIPEQKQMPIVPITRIQSGQTQLSDREILASLERNLRHEAACWRERLHTFHNRAEDEAYFRLEAERCENAARQIERRRLRRTVL